MKRTTLILEDGAFRGVKDLAHKQGRPMSEVVNDMIVEGLQRRLDEPRRKPFKLPTFKMGEPLVDISDRNALEEAMREGDERPY